MSVVQIDKDSCGNDDDAENESQDDTAHGVETSVGQSYERRCMGGAGKHDFSVMWEGG
jgi:hypothetical protein